VDITDPIHLLSYIFEGGPEPIACAQAPTSAELEYVLQKFFPKFENMVTIVVGNGSVEEVVVPPGKLFVLAAGISAGSPHILVDGVDPEGEQFDLWVNWFGNNSSASTPSQAPLLKYRVFQPGQVVTLLQSATSDCVYKGFYVDL
jgi:hypothetical protein